MEYGMQLSLLSPDIIKMYQGTQNIALRSMFSAPKKTSIVTMHRLAQLELMETRNLILNIKFAGSMHNSMNTTIPAVRIWRSAVQNLTKGSLTQKTKDNPLWNQCNWSNHLFNRLGSTADQPKALTATKQKEIARKAMTEFKNASTNIADTIEITGNEKHRFILTANTIAKATKITVTRWLLGIVAMHQSCRNCPEPTEVSRSHGQICSGALNYLQNVFEIPLYARSTPLDYLLNLNRHSTDTNFYEQISTAIAMIYDKCLNCEQSENGFWVPRRAHDNAQDTVP
jgi:hypothetical protein